MLDYLDGPCSWARTDPAELRRLAHGGASAWHSNATARFLGGIDPKVVHTVSFPELAFESGMHIELLPATLARRLRKAGLEFASVDVMNKMEFQSALANALELIRTVPPLLGTVAGLCRSLHVLAPPDIDFDSSYSDPSLPFSIFVSCPSPTEMNRTERLAEGIMHEALHLQLSLVESAEPLVVDSQDRTHFFSPWKNEPRTVHGLLHGVYVFANLRYFWSRVIGNATGYTTFAARRVEEIDGELASVEHLLTNPALTTAGQHLAKSLISSP